MQDNFTEDNAELVIRYMDGELSAEEKTKVEILLQTDESAREQYQFFLAAKQSVKSRGIRQRVAGIQHEYLQERKPAESISLPKKKRTSFIRPFMSVAAILLFLLIGTGTFIYLTTTTQNVYNNAYIAYQMPVNRGNEKTTQLQDAYNNGDYAAVINAFNTIPVKTQRDYFIAGLSYLQSNKADEAVASFQQLEKLNNVSNSKQYVQETDYYLMLSYLKASNISGAEKELDKIRSDKGHLFYEKAGSISRTKLMILKWKEK